MSYRLPWLALVFFALAGCAANPSATTGAPVNESPSDPEPTVVSFSDYQDPFMGLNRAIFGFNDAVYRTALIPTATLYLDLVPTPVQSGIGRFFANIKTPVSSVNFLLQGQLGRSAKSVLRFGVNSTLGLAGIFDPAEAWFNLQPETTNLNDTLAGWGAGYGVYLVLPLAGPADLRNSTGRLGDYFLNPLLYLVENPERLAIQGVGGLNNFAPTALNYDELTREVEDPYLYFRNLYLQGVMRDQAYPDNDESAD